MAGGRDVIAMTGPELAGFLAGQRKVQVATVGAGGAPHLTTLFYVVDDEGRLAFWTYARSQKVRNLERDPRLTCLVETGEEYDELRGASLTGTAELVRDPARLVAIGEAVATVMFGVASFAELGELGRAEVDRQARKRVAVVVHPTRVASWDHRKLSTTH